MTNISLHSAATPADAGGFGPLWRPSDHIDRPHLIASTGQLTTIESKWGVSEALIASLIIVVDPSTGNVQRYDDVRIIPKVLRQTLAEANVYTGLLRQTRGKQYTYYEWADIDDVWTDWYQRWAAAYLRQEPDGSIACSYEQPIPEHVNVRDRPQTHPQPAPATQQAPAAQPPPAPAPAPPPAPQSVSPPAVPAVPAPPALAPGEEYF